MTSAVRRYAVIGLLLVTAATSAGCSNGSTPILGTRAKDIGELPGDLVPAELLGLPAKQEDIKGALATTKRAYIDSVGLYSFRRDELLQATLQVSKFNDDAKWQTPKFRRSVVGQIGGSVPQRVRIGDDTVYLTSGTKQTLAMWYRGATSSSSPFARTTRSPVHCFARR